MPFQKKKTFRKRYVKRTYKRKPKTNFRKKVMKIVEGVKQVKHTQLEYQFSVNTGYTLAAPISYPSQGVAAFNNDETDNNEEGQRIGNTIFPRSFLFNYSLTIGDTTNFVRVVIFEWLVPINNSSEIPGAGDIFENPSTSYSYLSPLNYDNRKNYHILHDKVYKMVTNGSNEIMVGKLTFYAKNYRNKKWIFIGDSQSGTSASLTKGNTFLFATSDSSLPPHPQLSFSTRLTFTD